MTIEKFLNNRVLYINSEENLSYRKGYLYYQTNNNQLKKCHIGSFANNFKLIERLTRKEPRCGAKVDDVHFIVSFCGKILNYDSETNTVKEELRYERGMNNPLEFLTIKREDGKKDIYFGEYIWNEEKGPVAIYKRDAITEHWLKVYEFPEKKITHIHNIVEDSYRGGFLILTGDEDLESGIWFADKEFKNVQPLLLGRQQYRSCVAYSNKNGIYFATDTPLEKNHLYFAEVDQKLKVKMVQEIYEMPGPCIFGTRQGNVMYFATSVEPDSSLYKLRYHFTYRLGKGVKDRCSHIIRVIPEQRIDDICQFKKDILPIWLFQFGNVLFPQNDGEKLYAVLQGTMNGHGNTVGLKI